LQLDTLGNFQFASGDSFDIMDFASYAGDFTSLLLNGVACSQGGVDAWSCGSLGVTEVFGNGGSRLSLVMSVSNVPEPASLAVLGAGIAAMGWLRRRNTA
jgi:hypothetical protein